MSQAERIGALIFKYNWGGLSAKEQEVLDAWRLASEANEKLFLQETNLPEVLKEVETCLAAREKIWQKLVGDMPELKQDGGHSILNGQPVLRFRGWRVAATIAVFFVFALDSYNNWKSGRIEPGSYEAFAGPSEVTGSKVIDDIIRGFKTGIYGIDFVRKPNGDRIAMVPNIPGSSALASKELYTPRGGMMQFSMPTGAQFWLDAASTIRYPENFYISEEKFEISGKAFIEIPRDTTKTYRIAIRASVIKTSDARFGLTARPGDPVIDVAVIEGSVDFQIDTVSDTSIHLEAGQEFMYRKEFSLSGPLADTLVISAWTNGRIYYHSADIAWIMQDLAAWYDIDVSYWGNLTKRNYSLDLSRQASIEEIIEAFKAQGLNMHLLGRRLSVYSH